MTLSSHDPARRAEGAGTTDVGAIIDRGPWSRTAKAALALSALAVVLDGFDNQALGFALPAMIAEWGVARPQFAPVLALGLVGMALGTALAGMLGDRWGRRSTLIASVVVFGAATAAISLVRDVHTLAILRFIAGAGIGGALPNATALAAEFTPLRHRTIAITLAIVCLPLGGALGGMVASRLLPSLGWPLFFAIGGGAPLLFALILFRYLPESPRYLARHRGRRDELAALMRRLGHAGPVSAAPAEAGAPVAQQPTNASRGLRAILGPRYRKDTLPLAGAFFCCLFAVYSVFSWGPTLLSANGASLADAANAVAAYNLGGVLGAVICAWLIGMWGSRRPMLLMTALAAASAAVLGQIPPSVTGSLSGFVLLMSLHGFCVNGVQTTLYALAAHVYATEVRATGVGAAAAIGRTGAILSSFTGALVIEAGRGLYFQTLAGAMVLALVCLLLLRRHIPARGARVNRSQPGLSPSTTNSYIE